MAFPRPIVINKTMALGLRLAVSLKLHAGVLKPKNMLLLCTRDPPTFGTDLLFATSLYSVAFGFGRLERSSTLLGADLEPLLSFVVGLPIGLKKLGA